MGMDSRAVASSQVAVAVTPDEDRKLVVEEISGATGSSKTLQCIEVCPDTEQPRCQNGSSEPSVVQPAQVPNDSVRESSSSSSSVNRIKAAPSTEDSDEDEGETHDP